MHDNQLQKVFAYAALFLMPFPLLYIYQSLTVADVLLVIAVLLNASELTRIHKFQIPFLLATPFFLVSALQDPDGDFTSVLQTVYIWCFLLPFGWAAFTNISVRRIALVLLMSAALNSVVAVGQAAQIIPMLGDQKMIAAGQDTMRAAGLSRSCNTLVMILTPCILLLPYLRSPKIRLLFLLTLSAGLLATISKAVLLAVPGLCVYFWREPRKRQLLPYLVTAALLGIVALQNHFGGLEGIRLIIESAVERRMSTADHSVGNRLYVVEVAMDYATDCLLFGYGIEGTADRLIRAGNNTVHVYFLGLVVITGFPGTALVLTGIFMIVKSLYQLGEFEMAGFVVAHMLACLVTAVILFSCQSLPYLVAGAVAVRQSRLVAPAHPLLASRWRNGQLC